MTKDWGGPVAAIDVETNDPGLKTFGTGAIRGYGEILTVGVYCPMYHIDGWYTWEQFLDDDDVIDLLADESVLKVFHNGLYDLNWLCLWGKLEVNNVDDTMTRESLLDSYARSYSLDNCCIRRGVIGKNKGDTIDAWYAQHKGKGKAIEHLKDIPVDIVGKYNLQDCHATYDLYMAQRPLLEEQDLIGCNDVERRLYPWLLLTKKSGFRVDGAARNKLSNELNDQLAQMEQDFVTKYGNVNIGSYIEMEQLWNRLGIPVTYDPETKRPSFAKDVLLSVTHPVAKEILAIRGLRKLLTTYIDGAFVDLRIRGRLHPDLFPAKRDGKGGTVTGRFSSSDPNIQNVSAREEKHGNEVRGLFIPEEGCLLGAFDYKQIEYRMFLNYAVGPAAVAAREQFWKAHEAGHDIDYHEMGQKLMAWYWPEDRHRTKIFRHIVKNMGFGTLYGLGKNAFANDFGPLIRSAHPDDPRDDYHLANDLFDEYKSKIPFIKDTLYMIQHVCDRRGYVKDVAGRRQRKPPTGKLYVIVNYLCQGTAGDVVKKAIVDSWDAGVWDVLTPHAMVHDELVFSIPQSHEGYEACIKLRDCMENAYKGILRVPLGVDTEIGPDWAHCTMDNWYAFEAQFK